jgi:N-dimethylarginine dimethylaminohydrolase
MPSATPRLLMCRPDHFAVTYAINPWMDPAGWAAEARALAAASRREWHGLHGALAGAGAAIELLPPMPGLPDLVFTANAAVVMNGKALLARFRHPERQREEPPIERFFRGLAARGEIASVERLPDNLVLEGAGDCVWDEARRLFWMGYGPRSDRAAGAAVADAFGLEVAALELADPRFYHMDTTLCPLARGEVMYFAGAFTAAGRGEIEARIAPELRIPIDAEDAATLAANAVLVGDTVILSQCSPALRRRLEERGYRVVATPLGSFLKSGGSAVCLTLRLDRRSGVSSRSAAA